MTATQQPDPFGNAPPIGGPSGPRAGFWQRFGAVVIDTLVIAFAYVPLAVVFGSSVGSDLGLIVSIAYFTILEGGTTGQTLGKRALGIRVIDLGRGGPIGPGRAFIRLVGRLVSWIPIYLGYFWMLWDREKQTWHDKMAGSVVVPTSAYPVS